MADITTSNISAALKDYYLDALRVQINEEADPLWAELKKTAELVSGDNIVASLRYGRSGGIAALGETANLPTPNPRKSKKATFDTLNIYARGRIYEKAIRVGNSNRGSFVNQLEQALEDLLTDSKDYVEWQVHGDGTGKIATVATGGVNGTTLTLDTVVGLAEGMLVDIMTSGNAVRVSGAEITSVDDDNTKIVVSDATNVQATDYITRAGAYNNEMTGLTKVFTADNTVWGVDRSQAANKFFNPTRHNVNGEISEVAIQTGLDKSYTRAGTKIDFFIGSFGVQRAWMNLMIAFRQTINTVQLKGGWMAPVYQNGSGQQIPFLASKYAPAQKLRGLSRKNWLVAWLGDWDWMDRDGAILHRTADKAAYEFTLQLYADLFCDVPRGQVEYHTITEH